MLYVSNFKTILDNLLSYVHQTRVYRFLGKDLKITANADVINETYSNDSYSRASVSRKMLDYAGAHDSWVANTDERALVKRKINTKALKAEKYKLVSKDVSAALVRLLDKKLESDISPELYHILYEEFAISVLKRILGISYTDQLAKKISEVNFFGNNEGFNVPFTQLFLLNYFPIPAFIKNIVSRDSQERSKKLERLANIIYDHASASTPKSLYNDLKTAEQLGVLTKSEVLGEFRMLLINASSLANAVRWGAYALSKNPAAAEKVSKDKSYARLAFMETLRLYPLFYILAYEVAAKRCPVHFWKPKDTTLVSVFNVHRNPEYWENPEQFNPDRFSNGMAAIKKGAYIPFGGGNRSCPGVGFAMTVAPEILHVLFQNYDVTLRKEPIIKRSIELLPLNNRIEFNFTKNPR